MLDLLIRRISLISADRSGEIPPSALVGMVHRGEFSERITSREWIQAERNGTARGAAPNDLRGKFRKFSSSTAEIAL